MKLVTRRGPYTFDDFCDMVTEDQKADLIDDMGDVDVLGEVKGLGGYDQVLAQSVEKVVFGRAVRVLGIDGLIINKKAVDRVKDRLHLLELEELKKLRDAVQEN